MKSGVSDKMPSKEGVKANLRRTRQQFPLKRSRSDRVFMGVCGGIGQKIGIDANLVRLVWAAFSIGSIGMGVLIYVLVGLFLPEEQMAQLDISATSRTRCRSSTPAPGKRARRQIDERPASVWMPVAFLFCPLGRRAARRYNQRAESVGSGVLRCGGDRYGLAGEFCRWSGCGAGV